jgi:hypothetical protein
MFSFTVAATRRARAALCVMLLVAWSGAPRVQAQPAQRQPAARGLSDPAAAVGTVRARVARLVEAARQVSDEPLDPASLVASVGRDPAALAKWVREQVRYEPYSGFMKGATGAVVSRRANSADKALLLAEALRTAGVKAQLVRGKIDPSAQPKAELPPPENSPEPDAAALQAFATTAGLPVDRVRSLLDEGRARREAVAEDLWTRFERDFGVVAGQLQAAKVPPPPAPKSAAPGEHWWVRTAAGDLDPTTDAKPAAQEAGVFDVDKLPADAFHTLTVRMKIKKDDGAEAVVLDAPLRSADLFGGTVVLGNMPVEGMARLEKLGASDQPPTPKQLIDALASTTRFQPQLSTPSGPVAGAPFDLAGNVLPMSKGRFDHVADAGGAQRGAIGGFGLGGEPDPKEQKMSRLTACWVEIALGGPGSEQPLIVRRDLLVQAPAPAANDKDAAAQRVLDLLAMREMLVLPEELSASFSTQASLRFAAQWVEHLAGIVDTLAQRPLSVKNYAGAPRLNGTLVGFGTSRRAALRRLRDARFPGVTYVHARPTLVSHTRRFVTGPQPKSVAGIDILHNDLVPAGQAADDWSKSFTLAAGVLDTALEHVCNPGPGPHSNTSVALDQALLAGAAPAVGADAAKASDRAKQQMQADGPRAAHVVVPGPLAAWYRVDLDTGMALGFVEGGGGQDASEYVVVTDIIIQLKEVFEFYADMFKCIGIGVTAPLAGSLDARRDFLECAWNLICKKIPDMIAAMTGFEMDSWTNIIVHQTLQKTIWEGFCQKLFDDVGGPKK